MGPTIETLNDLAAFGFESILRSSWQGGLAIAAAWILVRCRPGLPPRVACWVWRLADLKLIVALVWVTPLLLPLLPPSPSPEPLPEPIATPDVSPTLAGASESVIVLTEEPAAIPAFPRPSLACVVLIVWLFGVVGAVIQVGRAWRAVARLRQSCSPVPDPDLRGAITELARVLGLRSVPEVRAGSVVARPMVVGAFCPAILLPIAMVGDSRSTDAIRPVLAHELAHIRRGDLWWSGLAGLVRALFFFHPLVWLAHREALVAREAACDALALRASGVRPSEYGRILLDIAAGGPDRLSQWAATLGMAGPAGSLKRRLMAMKTIQQPSRRRILSWAFALVALGAAGIIPWQLIPREALAQEPPPAPPTTQPTRDVRPSAAWREDQLKLVEARLKVAQAEQKVAEALVEQAEAEVESAAAEREYRGKQRDRMDQLVKRGAIEQRLLDEQTDQLRAAQAGERATKAKIADSRAALDVAKAAVREAEALRDIARVELQDPPDAKAKDQLKKAQARLRAARLDRARGERNGASAEVDRAKANWEKAQANVEYRTKQLERIQDLVNRHAVEERLLDEEKDAVNKARKAEREAEAAVELARIRLVVADQRVKWEEREAGASDHGPVTPSPGPNAPKKKLPFKVPKTNLERAGLHGTVSRDGRRKTIIPVLAEIGILGDIDRRSFQIPAARVVPSGEKARPVVRCSPSIAIVLTSRRWAVSQRRMTRSEAIASRWLEAWGENAIDETPCPSPRRSWCTSFAVATSQSRRVPSLLSVATVLPSGAKASSSSADRMSHSPRRTGRPVATSMKVSCQTLRFRSARTRLPRRR